MNLLTIIFLFAVIYVIAFGNNRKKTYLNLLIIYCFIGISFLKGNFYGESDLSRETVASIIFFVYSVYYAYMKKIQWPRKVVVAAFFFFLCVCLSGMYEMICPFDYPVLLGNAWENWALAGEGPVVLYDVPFLMIAKPIVKICIFIISVLIIKTVCDKNDYVYVCKYLLILSSIWLAYAGVEYILKNPFNMADQVHSFVNFVCGNGGANNPEGNPYFRNGTYSISGLTREPSHFSRSLFLFNMIALIYWKTLKTISIKSNSIKNIKKYIIISIVIMLISGSFSALLYIVGLSLFYIAIRNDFYMMSTDKFLSIIKKMGIFLFVLAVVVAYGLSSSDLYIFERLAQTFMQIDGFAQGGAVIDYAGEHSSYVRFYSIIYVFENTLHRPLLGLAPDVQSAFDTFITMWSHVGIIGIIAWLMFVFSHKKSDASYDPWAIVILVCVVGLPLSIGNPFNDVYIAMMLEFTSLYCNGRSSNKEEKLYG